MTARLFLFKTGCCVVNHKGSTHSTRRARTGEQGEHVRGAGGGKDDTEGVALGVAHLHGDAFEVNAGSKVDRRNYVL